jgi:phosphinothricin acetyltransferase
MHCTIDRKPYIVTVFFGKTLLTMNKTTNEGLLIRPSQEADLARVSEIYAYHVENGTGTFETTAPTLDEMRERWREVLGRGLPFLVATRGQSVLGFAYVNWFKPRPAFRFSAEDSIYIDPQSIGKGVGRELLQNLVRQSEACGVRKLIAVIGDSGNRGSIGLHQAMGFESVGTIKACGWKFGRWLDVVLMEKSLGQGAGTTPE